MEQKLKLCESDYRFMSVVWDNAPVESGRLVKLCAERLGWKKPTTYTVLRKMCERGLVRNEDSLVTVLVEREQVQRYESRRFIDGTFGGSLPDFIASFLGGRQISDKEAAELKAIIDAHTDDCDAGGANH